jgi:hypothetical protein
VSSKRALGKASVYVSCIITATFFLPSLCRVPDKKHSVKRSLPTKFLPCTLAFAEGKMTLALGKPCVSSSVVWLAQAWEQNARKYMPPR